MSISIVLADDHPVVRLGLRGALEAEPDFAVVGETGDGLETLQLVERLQPDVLVLDLIMPGLGGLDVLPIARQRSPRTRVVVFSMYANEDFILQALKNGASGYVLKGCEPAHAVEAVRRAAEGHSNVAIAERLSISPRTAEMHRANALRKLGLKSREELIRYAIRRGMLHPEV